MALGILYVQVINKDFNFDIWLFGFYQFYKSGSFFFASLFVHSWNGTNRKSVILALEKGGEDVSACTTLCVYIYISIPM